MHALCPENNRLRPLSVVISNRIVSPFFPIRVFTCDMENNSLGWLVAK